MPKTRAAVIALSLALAGCVSTVAPTTEPTASPTLGITTMAPTIEPTPSPTAAPPTEAPATAEPASSPTATSPVSPPASPGTDVQVLFSDDFSDLGGLCAGAPAGTPDCWGVGSNVAGTISYSEGTLDFEIPQSEAWMWSRRTLDESWPLIAVEGVAVPQTDGLFGAMCGTTDDAFIGGVVSTNGSWVIFRLESNTVTVLSSDPNAGLSVPVGLSTNFAIGCRGTDIGPFEIQLALAGSTVATYQGEGFANFDRVGLYAEASSPSYMASFDNVVVYGGRPPAGGQMSPAGQALLEHVPEAWRATCQETPPSAFESGAQVGIVCELDEPGANIVEYIQFDSTPNMNTAYQQRVDNYAVDSTGTCESGPNEAGYTIGGIPVGRLLCAPQLSGIRFDWTDERLNILTTLTDFETSYPDTYTDWLEAGPV